MLETIKQKIEESESLSLRLSKVLAAWKEDNDRAYAELSASIAKCQRLIQEVQNARI